MNLFISHKRFLFTAVYISMIFISACGSHRISTIYHDSEMDFSSLRVVAVMPFPNFSGNKMAAKRVRDILSNKLLSTTAFYIIPPGEVARGIYRAGISDTSALSMDEIVKIASIIKADALITGAVREYGVMKSGVTSANVISLSLQMIDVESRKTVWSAASTKGGISFLDRLFGGGGEPMNDITEAAVDDLIDKLFSN